MTRSIGRFDSPASATRRLSNVCPASNPARRRIVVPEFPQLISLLGGVRTRFFPCTIKVAGSGCSILIPSARSAFTVCIQSSLGRNPCRVHTPFDKAAMITARWEILLSPGTVISMSIRGARFTRNSIDKKKPLVNTQYGMLDKREAPRYFGAQYQHPASASNTLKATRYGTRKILSVYGSFTSVPGGKPSTSIYLPGE